MTDKETILKWLEFLKSFTRALVQINLYKPDHPQVAQALEESHKNLGLIFGDTAGADFSLTLDNDKLIANGVPLLGADKLPTSLKNIFTKFRLQTISFKSGVTQKEILSFCQMQSFKGDIKEYVSANGIENIVLNEAIYAKVDKTKPEVSAAPAAGSEPAEKIGEKIANEDLHKALETLISKLTSDPAEQKRILELLIEKLKSEIEKSIAKALEGIKKEKKKIENDMARTEAVISNIAEGVVVVDKEGKILMMNPQAEVMSGKPLSELSGKKIMDISALENQMLTLAKEIKSENQADISKEVTKTGKPEVNETIKKSTAIIQNEDGKIVGAVSVPTDVTKLNQIEQLKHDFIANITHELRSPLTSIQMALDLMSKETKLDEQTKNMLRAAIRNSARLNSIITDILDLSKLQSGKMIFHQESVKPEDVVKDAGDSMKAWATSKGVTLKLRNEPNLPAIYADKRRTTQIIINLVSNSIKFTPQGGTIEISADAGKEAMSGFVFFSVSDTGCGISKEDQAKIFEKFVQVAAGEKVGGTGLGLAITKAMIVMQGGRITVESEPGRGTTFRVGIPLYRGQLEVQAAEQPAIPQEPKAWWRKLLGI